jgi:phosphoribosyl-ATP pyrophosphohydrolase
MLILLLISIIIGAAVSGATGFALPGWIAGGFIFFCGLPGALLVSFIHGEVSYAQDRADWRQCQSDLLNSMQAEARERVEEERVERLIETAKKNRKQVFHDNRQVHFHTHLNYDRKELM